MYYSPSTADAATTSLGTTLSLIDQVGRAWLSELPVYFFRFVFPVMWIERDSVHARFHSPLFPGWRATFMVDTPFRLI